MKGDKELAEIMKSMISATSSSNLRNSQVTDTQKKRRRKDTVNKSNEVDLNSFISGDNYDNSVSMISDSIELAFDGEKRLITRGGSQFITIENFLPIEVANELSNYLHGIEESQW